MASKRAHVFKSSDLQPTSAPTQLLSNNLCWNSVGRILPRLKLLLSLELLKRLGVMSKRIIAAIIGLLAIAAGLVACGFTLEVAHDFRSPETPFWGNVFGSLFMGAVALCGLTFGIRFLQFAWFGTSQPITGRVSSVLLGLGFFFPGFVFSLPFTILLWVTHKWPDGTENDLAAFLASFFIGISAAIACCLILSFKRRSQGKSEGSGQKA